MIQSHNPPANTAGLPTVGPWVLTVMPTGWLFLEGFGIKQQVSGEQAVAASIGLGQDELKDGQDLASYITVQTGMITNHLGEAQVAGPRAVEFEGAAEACLLFIRHTPANVGSMLHAQTYARRGRWVGIITLTTLESQLRFVRADYDAFLKGLRIGNDPAP